MKFLTIMTNNFQISDIGTVEKIEAISLTYFLDQSEEWQVMQDQEYKRLK